MKWTKPVVEEITLGMEVTAYVNTDVARRFEPHTEVASEVAAADTPSPDPVA